MRLSPHFTLHELCRSETAVSCGVQNDPDAQQISALTLLSHHILEPLRASFKIPFTPTSAFRSLALNRLLGSRDSSQHIRGEAADLKLAGIATYDLANWISENLVFDQLILECVTTGEPTSGWVHCSFSENCARGERLTYREGQYFKGLA
jgi:zinc D-Ala-D-Ala carboxypeptidase